MGGYGSGRQWYVGANETVNNYESIDIRKWHRNDLLRPGIVFTTKWIRDFETIGSIKTFALDDCILLSDRYRKDLEEWTDVNCIVRLEWTPCKFGGKRPWFLCPAKGCGRRAAILYGDKFFACRYCYQLVYPSQRETLENRAMRRADKIRGKLGWDLGILNGEGLKPKGMHWQTFEKLSLLHDKFVYQALKEAEEKFGEKFWERDPREILFY